LLLEKKYMSIVVIQDCFRKYLFIKTDVGLINIKHNSNDEPTMTPSLLKTLDNRDDREKNRAYNSTETTISTTEYNLIIEWE